MTQRRRRKRQKQRRQEPRQRPDRLGRQLATGAGVTVGATMLMGGVAQAAPMTFTVGSLDDTTGAIDCADATNTDCTLRQAITDANANSGADTIAFRSGLTGAINLTAGELSITDGLTVQGPGANQLTVSGNHASRVFRVGAAAATISGLTITAGSSGADGGGIYAKYAGLTVSDSVVTDSHAAAGGGIAVRGSGSSLTVTSSTISGNTAGRGSGVYLESGAGNPTTIRASTISGNSGADFGGGVYFDFTSPATVENSTIYDNSAGTGGGLYDYGAYDGDPGLTVTGSTITLNTANRGGGIACYGATGTMHTLTEPILHNTIVFGNNASSADQGNDVSCDINSNPVDAGTVPASFSLLGSVDPGTGIVQTPPGSDIFGQDPQLGSLAGNGGSTPTQLPANTSPVVNKGSAFGLTTDQRGVTRPVAFPGVANSTAAGADGSDIGAVELQLPPPAAQTTPAPPAAKKKKKCKKKKKHKRSAESAKKKKCKKKKKKT